MRCPTVSVSDEISLAISTRLLKLLSTISQVIQETEFVIGFCIRRILVIPILNLSLRNLAQTCPVVYGNTELGD